MFEGRDSFRGVPDPKFFLNADGADSDGVAADIALTVLNRVVHIYESNGAAQAAYAITLPPVGESTGLVFSFTSVEDLGTYNVTIQDQDESFDWSDIILTGDNETVVLYSDGRRWHTLSRIPYAKTQTLLATGAVIPGVRVLILDHTSAAILAAMADAKAHQGLFVINVLTEPGGGQDHVVTITTGSWNGTNKVITFADIADQLIVYFDSAGAGTIILNTGGALSG